MSGAPNATGDNRQAVNDSGRTLAHNRFAQQVRPQMHTPGDQPWKTLEILLFVAGAICIFTAAALAMPDWSMAIQ
jgi:hypothetical protein